MKGLSRVRDVRISLNAIARLVPHSPRQRGANPARLVFPRRNMPYSLTLHAFHLRFNRAFVFSQLGFLTSLNVRKIYGYLACLCVSLRTVYHIYEPHSVDHTGNELVRRTSIYVYISLGPVANWSERPPRKAKKMIR